MTCGSIFVMRIYATLLWMICLVSPLLAVEGLTLHPLMTIEGKVGTRSLRVLIDTGVSGVALDSRLAEELGAKPKGITKTRTASEVTGFTTLESVDLLVGDLRCHEGTVFVGMDLSLASTVYGHPIDAVVGMGLLKNRVLVMDFDRGVFTIKEELTDSDVPKWAMSPDAITRPMTYDSLGHSMVLLSKSLGPAMIDTGAHNGVIVSKTRHDEFEAKGLTRQLATYMPPVFVDATGLRKGEQPWTVALPLDDLPSVEVAAGTFPKPDREDAIIGMDLMRHFNWILDFSKGTVLYTKSSKFGAPPKQGKTGLRLGKVEGKVVVFSEVPPNSPAGRQDVRKGDILTHCEDRPVEQWANLFEISDVLSGPEQAKVKLTFLREGVAREVVITLEAPRGEG
jgi:predicted aspartyl protease